MTIAVSLDKVAKSFGTGDATVSALCGISLDIPTGELFMLIGPSGCGKTTLISIIAGILRHDAGAVRLLGTDLGGLPEQAKADFRARHVGFIFQQLNLVPTLTVQENVALPLQIIGRPRRLAMARAAEVLDDLGLGDRLRALPPALSGGQQQRIAIARAIIHDPAVLVCDEPTSALDHDRGRQIMNVLRSKAVRPGRALLVVTHDTRIFPFSDRIASMEDGAIQRVIRRRFDPDRLDEPVDVDQPIPLT